MPGKAKPASEYKKKFRWHDSHLSSSFKPSSDQTMPSAGLSSSAIGHVKKEISEPPLQQRRKPLDNSVKRTYTTSQFYNPTQSSSEDGSVPQSRPRTKKHPKRSHDGTKPRSPTQDHERPQMSAGMRPSETKILAKNDQNKKKTSGAKDDRRKTYSKLTNGHHSSGGAVSGSSGGSKSRDGHRSSNDSGKSSKKPHDVDAALQYQAGIRARPLGPRYLSEYQRQFDWKLSNKESPLIAADQLIHKSNTNLAPFDPSKIPKKTEYNTQFKAYYPPAPSLQQQLKENVDREMKAKYKVKTKSKKNKKVQLSPDQMKTAGKPSVVVHEDGRLLEVLQNPQRPFFPHASVRKWRSEYHSNFKSPSLFSYEDGVWKGANPPHIQPQDSSSEGDKQNSKLRHAKSEGDIPSWFAEVLELRNRAQEYQRRSRGTHFSREHLAQLFADNVKAINGSSTAASTSSSTTSLSGADLPERAEKITKSTYDKVPDSSKLTDGEGIRDKEAQEDEQPSPQPARPSPVRRKLAWEEKEAEKDPDPNRRSSYGSIPTPDGYRGSISDNSEELSVLSGEGRLPTPRLESGVQKQRHHLDKTTPASGGAILTSPPRRKDVHPRPRTAPTRAAMSQRTSGEGRQNINSVRNPAQERVETIVPGGISKAFEYDSDEDDDNYNHSSLSSKEEDRTLDRASTVPKTPPRDPSKRDITQTENSPIAGKKTHDPDPLSPPHKHPAATFQRHSNNYFETSFAMPVMPTKVEPPKTWAGHHREPTAAAEKSDLREPPLTAANKEELSKGRTYNLKDGPLNRPTSASIHGRPQTAYPQTREQAAKVASRRVDTDDRPSSFISNGTPGKVPPSPNGIEIPQKGRYERDSDDLSLSSLSTNSSISLASEVLERAKKRRDDFWGKKMR